MKHRYVPKQGDCISIDCNPQIGHEQQGRRPALVLSKTLFNKKTNLAIICPVTHTYRRDSIQFKIPSGLKIDGFIMVEQVKSIDYTARKARFIQQAPGDILQEALARLDACLFD